MRASSIAIEGVSTHAFSFHFDLHRSIVSICACWSVHSCPRLPTVNPIYQFNGGNAKLPLSSVVRNTSGVFYGTTYEGGAGDGVIYYLTPGASGYTESIAANFSGSNGAGPVGDLVLSGTNLYEVTLSGGTNNVGTVYVLDTATNVVTTLHSFNSTTEGVAPYAGPIDDAGFLYGTVSHDGASPGVGAVYKVKANGKGFKIIHQFTDGADGSGPLCGLVKGVNGDLFGTTSGLYSTQGSLGTVFYISTSETRTAYCTTSSVPTDTRRRRANSSTSMECFTAPPSWWRRKSDGTLFAITEAGSFTSLHSFSEAPTDPTPTNRW